MRTATPVRRRVPRAVEEESSPAPPVGLTRRAGTIVGARRALPLDGPARGAEQVTSEEQIEMLYTTKSHGRGAGVRVDCHHARPRPAARPLNRRCPAARQRDGQAGDLHALGGHDHLGGPGDRGPRATAVARPRARHRLPSGGADDRHARGPSDRALPRQDGGTPGAGGLHALRRAGSRDMRAPDWPACSTASRPPPTAAAGDLPRAKAGGVPWTMPAVRIEDEPRFAWRGMHLDVGRHFFPWSSSSGTSTCWRSTR